MKADNVLSGLFEDNTQKNIHFSIHDKILGLFH